VRWETKQTFDGQLYQEYSYQNLLKSDHFSLSYDKKILVCFFMPHSVVADRHRHAAYPNKHWRRASYECQYRWPWNL